MRQDNVVNGLRSLSSHLRSRSSDLRSLSSQASDLLRAHLINTPRRAAAFGVAAAIGSTALLMSTTHGSAVNAEMAKAAVVQQAAERSGTADDAATTRSNDRAATPQATAAPKPTAKPAPKKPVVVQPVAGLDATQMKNATAIVRAGQELGISKRGQIIAVATAMQESNLYNLASYVVPESLQYKHDGYGADYDSVGLFQQRYTTGWGTVKSIMNPSESAKKFYRALMQVPGWQQLPVTVAAQTVQGSAFPDAYAPHEGAATTVVTAVDAAH
jgi:hypothetical protein